MEERVVGVDVDVVVLRTKDVGLWCLACCVAPRGCVKIIIAISTLTISLFILRSRDIKAPQILDSLGL